MSSIIFFFFFFQLTLQFAASSFPCCGVSPGLHVSYISVFPVWLFLGLGSGGEIKQTPILKLTGSPKSEPEGSTSPPSQPSPSLTEAASDKGAVCYKLLWGGRNTTGRVIWCSFDPLRPLRWKGFQFLPDKEDHFSTEPLRASKLSRIFNRRQITVYCGVCYAPSPRPERAKGQK